MSLHIGRLSRDVRQGYLEHLFEKFGHCTVKLKNGYGFAVYDANDDAARAMRALHGKYVCGERITVHWSKQQPRFSQSFRRSSRFVESSHGRTSIDGVDNFRFRDSLARKNHPTSHGQSHNPDDAPEKKSDEIAEVLKDAGENICEDPGEMKRDEGGTSDANEGGTSDANAIEHDRWGETGKGNPGGDGDDFDRYEPYHGYGRQEETEKAVKASSYDSHDRRRSSEKWQEHPVEHSDLKHDKPKSAPSCYNCSTAGHIARNCPQETDGKFKAWTGRLSLREKQELRLRRFRSPSRRRPEFHVDPMIQTHHRVPDGRKPFSDRTGRAPRLSNVSRENRRHTPHNDNMPRAPKEAHKRSRSKRYRESSLSSDRRTSLHSRSRSSRSHSRAPSPSHSAHSSSKSSQPTQPEGLRLRSGLNSEVPITSFMFDTLSNGEPLVPGKDAKVSGYTETNLDKNLVVDDIVANEVQGQKTNLEDTSSVKSNQENLAKNGRSNSLKLTTNEVVSALKCYGMEARDIDLLNQPVEKYFGAARLWPWEIIYYRRRKKGPISTENYAKRLEQNKEYGIVDQYVRSSSGWWECH